MRRNDYPYDTIYNEGPIPSESTSEGFAQVFVNKEWGLVCNMKMDDANTFCRQLSYTGALGVRDTHFS